MAHFFRGDFSPHPDFRQTRHQLSHEKMSLSQTKWDIFLANFDNFYFWFTMNYLGTEEIAMSSKRRTMAPSGYSALLLLTPPCPQPPAGLLRLSLFTHLLAFSVRPWRLVQGRTSERVSLRHHVRDLSRLRHCRPFPFWCLYWRAPLGA